MHNSRLATWEGSPSFDGSRRRRGSAERGALAPAFRSVAVVLALSFTFLAGLSFHTQTSAHAAPLIGRAVVAVASVASAIPSSPTTGVGDVAYYGNSTVYAGSRDGAVARSAMPATKSGKYGALLGALGTGLSLAVGWDFGLGADAAPLGYADATGTPASAGPNAAADGKVFTFTCAHVSSSSGCASPLNSWSRQTMVVTDVAVNAVNFYAVRTGGVVTSGGMTPWNSPGRDFGFSPGAGLEGFAAWTNTSLTYTQARDSGALDFMWGTLLPPAPPVGEPGATSVTTTTSSTCRPVGGGTSYSTASTSITYTRNTAPAVLPDITIPACNGSDVRTGINQTSTTSDGRTVTDPLGDLGTPIIPAGYSLCQTTACALELVRLTPGFAGSPDSDVFICNGTTGCAGALNPQLAPRTGTQVKIATATSTGTQTAAETTWEGSEKRARIPDGREYECRYGPYRVALSECAPVPHEHPTPPETPESESNCNLSDFSLNPVSWVVVPLKCLFIPRESVMRAHTGNLTGAWDATPPAVVGSAVSDLVSPLGDLTDGTTSCDGPLFSVPIPFSDPWPLHPFSACGPILATASEWALRLGTFLAYLSTLAVAARTLSRTIGADSPLDGAA